MTPFDIVLVPFPFADLSTSKRRPCLILSAYKPRSMSEHIIVAMMTSRVEAPRFPFDVEILEIEAAHLPKPTLVRLGKVVTLDSRMVIKKIGLLHRSDQKTIGKTFKDLFKHML